MHTETNQPRPEGIAASCPQGDPLHVRVCSHNECTRADPFASWDDLAAVLCWDHAWLLRVGDTVYFMPRLREPMWGTA